MFWYSKRACRLFKITLWSCKQKIVNSYILCNQLLNFLKRSANFYRQTLIIGHKLCIWSSSSILYTTHKYLQPRADCDAPCFEQLKATHLRVSPKQQWLLDMLLQLIKTWPLIIGPCLQHILVNPNFFWSYEFWLHM